MNFLKKVFKGFEYLPPDLRNFRGQVLPFWDTRGATLLRRAYSDGKRWNRELRIVHDGRVEDLPAANTCNPGDMAIIDQPAPDTASWTRPAAVVKLSGMLWWVTYLADGTTLVWKPVGEQVLYSVVGNSTNPWLASFTATGASGTVGEFAEIPAGMLAAANLILSAQGFCGRGDVAAATGDLLIAIDGTPSVVLAAMAGNVNTIGWLEGVMMTRSPTTQVQSYSLTPGGKGNIASGTNFNAAHSLGATKRLSLLHATATANDKFTGIAMTLKVAG